MNKELNQKLYTAVSGEKIDLAYIEELLASGADPLGPLTEYESSCTLAEMFCEASEPTGWDDDNGCNQVREYMPKLVSMFLEYGMNPADIREKEDNADDTNSTMWSMALCCGKESTEVLKLLLDNGLKVKALEDFISHFYTDAEMCNGSDIDEYYLDYLTYGFKMIMLSASYPEVLNSSEYLRSCIEMDNTNKGNDYDLTGFADYERYEYTFDVSTCNIVPYGLRNTTVEIREKGHNEIVWKMHI